jgi:YD repeat-containing protein
VSVKASGVKFGFLLCLFLLILLIGPAFSDTVKYIYDNLGRLVMTVSSSGTKVIYGYDQAGHLISVTRTTENQQPPMLTGITPRNVFIGNDVSITIAGSNLLTTDSVKTDNAGIRIINYSANNDSVTIDAQIRNTAATGLTTFTVSTLSGSASISLNLLNLTFTPAQIALATGTSGSITARIDGLSSDYNLVLTNQKPDIITAPQTLIVPASGSTTFQINTLINGTGVIIAGNSAISIWPETDRRVIAETAGRQPRRN